MSAMQYNVTSVWDKIDEYWNHLAEDGTRQVPPGSLGNSKVNNDDDE